MEQTENAKAWDVGLIDKWDVRTGYIIKPGLMYTIEEAKAVVERRKAELDKVADVERRYAYYVQRWIGFGDFQCHNAYEDMGLDQFLASNANKLGFGCYYDHWWNFTPESGGLTVKQYLDKQVDEDFDKMLAEERKDIPKISADED